MSGRVPAEQPVEPAEQERPVAAALQPAKVFLHIRRPPRGVAGQLPDMVPVGIIGPHDDHRVMAGAATKTTSAWVEHSVNGFAVPGLAVPPILLLLRRVSVMTHPEVPSEAGVLGGKRMKRRNAVIRRQRPITGYVIASVQR